MENLETACAARIMERRKFLNINQETLERDSGIHSKSLSRIENNKQSITIEDVFKLAKILNVTPGWLAFGDPQIPIEIAEFVDQFMSLPELERRLTRQCMETLQARLAATTPPTLPVSAGQKSLTPAQIRFAELSPNEQRIVTYLHGDIPAEESNPAPSDAPKSKRKSAPPKS